MNHRPECNRSTQMCRSYILLQLISVLSLESHDTHSVGLWDNLSSAVILPSHHCSTSLLFEKKQLCTTLNKELYSSSTHNTKKHKKTHSLLSKTFLSTAKLGISLKITFS